MHRTGISIVRRRTVSTERIVLRVVSRYRLTDCQPLCARFLSHMYTHTHMYTNNIYITMQ